MSFLELILLKHNEFLCLQVKPTSVVSVGCHESSGRQKDSVKCEGAGSSYVRGFADSAKVNAVSPYSYPLGPVSCCTPAVLLSNGDLWSTKRCGCTEVSHASCDAEDGQSTHLLVEFRQARESRSGDFVPIAPVTCCKACLGSKIMDTTCSDLNKCSGNGRCTFGACECISVSITHVGLPPS